MKLSAGHHCALFFLAVDERLNMLSAICVALMGLVDIATFTFILL
jgi:hypothetical protein